MQKQKTKLGLYAHIPFCLKKCDYCDFLSAPANQETQAAYINALERELEQTFSAGVLSLYEIDSIFIGGGTPTALSDDLLEQLCFGINKWIPFHEKMEITIECNPGTVTDQKLRLLKAFQINRLSFGLQSSSDEELRLLGRIHTYETFLNNYQAAIEAGFTNINIDLMSALPKQTFVSYCQTLARIAALKPQHISAYSLMIEEGTPFFERYSEDEKRRALGEQTEALPDEETERAIYEETNQYLKERGYVRYEISNYAKPGFECRHNCGYWTGKPYIGVGLGASSYFNGQRFHKTKSLKQYLRGDFKRYNIETLTKQMRIEEFMFLGLRMTEGVSVARFQSLFEIDIFKVYKDQLKYLFREKLLMQTDNDAICLTKRGLDLSNYVFEQFLL